jgi:transposase
VPRKSHAKKDVKRAEAFQHEIVQRLTALSIPADRRVRVWVEDEHRYGLISVVRRCWTLRGHRPTAPYQTKYQWGYVSGAAEVVCGQVEFLYLPTVSLDGSLIFLHQLVATDPQAIHIVLWDQAGFHFKADDPRLPASVRLVPLPPYSPELNPMESLWDQVKRRVANEVWDTLEAIEAAITEVLESLWQSVQPVRSLLGDTWLTRGVATFLKQRMSPI